MHPTKKILATVLRTELESQSEAVQKQIRDYFARILITSVNDEKYIKETLDDEVISDTYDDNIEDRFVDPSDEESTESGEIPPYEDTPEGSASPSYSYYGYGYQY